MKLGMSSGKRRLRAGRLGQKNRPEYEISDQNTMFKSMKQLASQNELSKRFRRNILPTYS